MLEFEEQRLRLRALSAELTDLKSAINYDGLTTQISELEEMSAQDGFWNDIENSQKIVQKLSLLKNKKKSYDDLSLLYEDSLALIDMADEAEDLSLLDEVLELVNDFEKTLSSQKLETLLIGEYDSNNAILTFHAGAGGTEAQDWNEMLVRMYTRWGEAHGFKVKTLDFRR